MGRLHSSRKQSRVRMRFKGTSMYSKRQIAQGTNGTTAFTPDRIWLKLIEDCKLQLNLAVQSRNIHLKYPPTWVTIMPKSFSDCSGGNSSPSYPADTGGCIFSSPLSIP
jgi:hypothetical protein